MMSESSRGLFQRAIPMAGLAIQNTVMTRPQRIPWAQRLASRLGFNSTSERDILNFLENANPVAIVTEQSNLVSPEADVTDETALPFAPITEPYITEGVFQSSSDFSSLLANSWSNQVELLIGQTSVEVMGVIVTVRLLPESMPIFANFQNYIPNELNVERNTEKSRKYAEMIRRHYYGVLQPTLTNIDGVLFVSSDPRSTFLSF